jgi:opacity protein-like surface antigen
MISPRGGMRYRSRMTVAAPAWVLLGLLAECEAGAAPEGAAPAAARRGWYLGLAAAGVSLDTDPLEIPEPGLRVEREGGGVEVAVGYAFSEVLALELCGVYTEHATNRDVEAALGQLRLDLVTHLREGKRLQPYMAGGLGAAGFALGGSAGGHTTTSGGQAAMGGGVEFHAARHVALALDYRYAIYHYEKLETKLGDLTLGRSIDREGDASTWSLRVAWSL